MENIVIRNETERDYAAVENLTREAFWNKNVPGCDEHYLAHIMRNHTDFVRELDFVAELDGAIVGSIMFTRSRLADENGAEKQILTFGPISVLPEFQRRGIGKRLIEYASAKAAEMGFEAIVIFGNPDNYVSSGFISCKRRNICLEGDIFPCAMLVKELKPNVFDGRKWRFYESPLYNFDGGEAEKFDSKFPSKEKKVLPCQEEFYIHSHSVIRD